MAASTVPTVSVLELNTDESDSPTVMRECPMTNSVVIGRGAACDIIINRDIISSNHCVVRWSPQNGITVEDTSRNGVTVNHTRLEKNVCTPINADSRVYLANKKTPSGSHSIWMQFGTPNQEAEGDQRDPDSTQYQPIEVAATQTEVSTQMGDTAAVAVTSDNVSNCASPMTAVARTPRSGRKFVVPSASDVAESLLTASSPVGSKRLHDQPITSQLASQPKRSLPSTPDPPNASKASTESNARELALGSGASCKPIDPHDSSAAMENNLLCVICTEVFHDPVSVQPCLHTFCAGCYSGWMTKSKKCPACRADVVRISKNYLVSNLCQIFLDAHPERRRSDEDLAALEEANRISEDMVKQPNCAPSQLLDLDFDSDRGSDDDSSESDTDYSQVATNISAVRFMLPQQAVITCQQCPGRTSDDTGGFQCPATGARHITCQCCARFMPDRRDCPDVCQTCAVCKQPYCRLYFNGACRLSSSGGSCPPCIDEFGLLRLTQVEENGILNHNIHESLILHDHLAEQGLTFDTFFQQHVLAQLPAEGVNSGRDAVCRACAMKVVGELCFEYRLSVPPDQLPRAVTNRPDCWHGRLCTTQHSRPHHARRFNHICPGTSTPST